MALVGFNSDKYQFEEVNRDEENAFAKEINAINKRISNISINITREEVEELFRIIGKKYLESIYNEKKMEEKIKIERKLDQKYNK